MDGRRKTSLFRTVNDGISELLSRFGATEQAEFFCECSSARCARRVALTRDEYEAIKARGGFVLAPECVEGSGGGDDELRQDRGRLRSARWGRGMSLGIASPRLRRG